MNLTQRMDAMAFWLMQTFPGPGPVKVTWVDHIRPDDHEDLPKSVVAAGDAAQFRIEKRSRYIIELSRKRCRDHDWLTETLIHEWAHLVSMKRGSLENQRDGGHDAEWGIAYARIYRAFYEQGGWEEVRDIHKRLAEAAPKPEAAPESLL